MPFRFSQDQRWLVALSDWLDDSPNVGSLCLYMSFPTHRDHAGSCFLPACDLPRDRACKVAGNMMDPMLISAAVGAEGKRDPTKHH